MYAMAHVWRSEDNSRELILSYHVGSRDETQVLRVGSVFTC